MKIISGIQVPEEIRKVLDLLIGNIPKEKRWLEESCGACMKCGERSGEKVKDWVVEWSPSDGGNGKYSLSVVCVF